MARQPIQSTKATRRPRSTCAGTHRSSSAMHCCPHGDGSLCASRFASVAWAAVQDIGSTAALLTEMASRYAISNLDVVLPWAAAGNRENHSKKKKGTSGKKPRFQAISRIRCPEEIFQRYPVSQINFIRNASDTQLIDGTLVGGAPSLFLEAVRSPVNLATDP